MTTLTSSAGGPLGHRQVRSLYPGITENHLRYLEKWGLLRHQSHLPREMRQYTFPDIQAIKQVASELRTRYSAIHFDVLTALPCLENFGSWPYDRKMDSEYRNAMFAQFSHHDRVAGSEQNRDWAVSNDHFGCGKLPGPYGEDAPFWPVPLWQSY